MLWNAIETGRKTWGGGAKEWKQHPAKGWSQQKAERGTPGGWRPHLLIVLPLWVTISVCFRGHAQISVLEGGCYWGERWRVVWKTGRGDRDLVTRVSPCESSVGGEGRECSFPFCLVQWMPKSSQFSLRVFVILYTYPWWLEIICIYCSIHVNHSNSREKELQTSKKFIWIHFWNSILIYPFLSGSLMPYQNYF